MKLRTGLGVAPKVHLYGKKEAKHKRKMGHVNVLDGDVDDGAGLDMKKQTFGRCKERLDV